MKKYPFVSVCLATHDRLEDLKNCLGALVDQEYPKDKYEIIVVEDGSHSGAKDLIKQLRANGQQPKALKYFWQKNQGPASARNKAISKAKGEIIAFTDDDTVPPNDWISRLVDGFARHPGVAAVGGIQEESAEELKRNPYARYESWITREFYGAKDKEIKGGFEVPTGGTNNVAYRKDILDKYGAFDEYFGIVAPGVVISGEDPDLKKRVCASGEKFLYIPMKVLHKRKFTLKGLAKQSWTRGTGIIHFARKHKDEHMPTGGELYFQLFKLPLATLKSVVTMSDKALVLPQFIDRLFTIKGQLEYRRVVSTREKSDTIVAV
jgi:glycosyltransferase involved in cell wall biosynthesis